MQMDATLFLFSVGKQSYTVKLVTAMFVVQLFFFKAAEVLRGGRGLRGRLCLSYKQKAQNYQVGFSFNHKTIRF